MAIQNLVSNNNDHIEHVKNKTMLFEFFKYIHDKKKLWHFLAWKKVLVMICEGHMTTLKNVSYKDACNFFFNFLELFMICKSNYSIKKPTKKHLSCCMCPHRCPTETSQNFCVNLEKQHWLLHSYTNTKNKLFNSLFFSSSFMIGAEMEVN